MIDPFSNLDVEQFQGKRCRGEIEDKVRKSW